MKYNRRNETWQEAQSVFEKIVTIFPAKIKEVFLVYQYTAEAPMLGLGHFVDDYLLDFDIYHVSHVTELLLYIDTKYLSSELGRFLSPVPANINWSDVQAGPTTRIMTPGCLSSSPWTPLLTSAPASPGTSTPSSTSSSRRTSVSSTTTTAWERWIYLKYFCSLVIFLNISQVAHKNRAYYRQLRTDLHDLSTDGLYLQEGLPDDGANGMQKLSGKAEINDSYFIDLASHYGVVIDTDNKQQKIQEIHN